MQDLLNDIEIIESALIGINEGASDEVYAAIYSLEKLLLKKKEQFDNFEAEFDKFFSKDIEDLEITYIR